MESMQGRSHDFSMGGGKVEKGHTVAKHQQMPIVREERVKP